MVRKFFDTLIEEKEIKFALEWMLIHYLRKLITFCSIRALGKVMDF